MPATITIAIMPYSILFCWAIENVQQNKILYGIIAIVIVAGIAYGGYYWIYKKK
jgi:hypothetical protein